MSIEDSRHRICPDCNGKGENTHHHAVDPECRSCLDDDCDGHKLHVTCSRCAGTAEIAVEAPGEINGVLTPVLVPVDMSRGTRSDHPDLNTESQYLIRYRGNMYAGHFSRQHYGWNFQGGPYPAGVQFDTPGTNYSQWEAIWEMVSLSGV